MTLRGMWGNKRGWLAEIFFLLVALWDYVTKEMWRK